MYDTPNQGVYSAKTCRKGKLKSQTLLLLPAPQETFLMSTNSF